MVNRICKIETINFQYDNNSKRLIEGIQLENKDNLNLPTLVPIDGIWEANFKCCNCGNTALFGRNQFNVQNYQQQNFIQYPILEERYYPFSFLENMKNVFDCLVWRDLNQNSLVENINYSEVDMFGFRCRNCCNLYLGIYKFGSGNSGDRGIAIPSVMYFVEIINIQIEDENELFKYLIAKPNFII